MILFKNNLFTFNLDGIVYNLTNSSSPITEIVKAPVVTTSGGTTDLSLVNDKLCKDGVSPPYQKREALKMVFLNRIIEKH